MEGAEGDTARGARAGGIEEWVEGPREERRTEVFVKIAEGVTERRLRSCIWVAFRETSVALNEPEFAERETVS